MLQVIVDNIKMIGACVTGITACGTGYVYLDGPVPASKHWVISETQTLKRDIIDNRLQTNTVQRQLLRKEQFDRKLDIEKAPDHNVKAILQQRLENIIDELDNVEREREDLIKEKRK